MTYIGYKYGDRAYRFMNIEAGHAMQNMYLIATSLQIGCVASGGFLDDIFFEWLGLENNNMFLLYEGFIGYIEEW